MIDYSLRLEAKLPENRCVVLVASWWLPTTFSSSGWSADFQEEVSKADSYAVERLAAKAREVVYLLMPSDWKPHLVSMDVTVWKDGRVVADLGAAD